jgi:hypothetical protein
VAIDGHHPSYSTLDYAFTEASLHQVPVLVVHSAPLAELASGEQNTRLNMAEILAGWKADYPDINVGTLLLAGAPRDTVASGSAAAQLLVVGSPYRGQLSGCRHPAAVSAFRDRGLDARNACKEI